MMPRLALRAIAVSAWKWMPGMMVNGRILDFSPAGSTVIRGTFLVAEVDGNVPRTAWGSQAILDASPVLEDPATKGCLLELVRNAFPGAPATTDVILAWCKAERRDRRKWVCNFKNNDEFCQVTGDTEEEALVLALEAADGDAK